MHFSTHKKNQQMLMVEVYRTINHLNPEYMWELFTKRDYPYNLRSRAVANGEGGWGAERAPKDHKLPFHRKFDLI